MRRVMVRYAALESKQQQKNATPPSKRTQSKKARKAKKEGSGGKRARRISPSLPSSIRLLAHCVCERASDSGAAKGKNERLNGSVNRQERGINK